MGGFSLGIGDILVEMNFKFLVQLLNLLNKHVFHRLQLFIVFVFRFLALCVVMVLHFLQFSIFLFFYRENHFP